MTRPIGNRNDYTGNSSTPDYDYTFPISSEDHLLVTARSPLGVESTLTKTTHYTVSGVGESAGGEISLVDGAFDWIDDDGFLETGWHLTIRRKRPLTQETDIRNQGDFYPESHEDEFDARNDIAQQQQDELDRSIKLPETVAASGFDTALPADIEDNPLATIIVNAAGDGLDLGPTKGKIEGAQAASVAAIAAQAAAEAAQTAAEIAQAAAEAASGSMTLASQAEAEAGTDNTKYLSSLRVDQAIQARKVRSGTVAIATGALAINATLYDVVNTTVDGDFTLNIPTNGQAGQRVSVRLTQDGSGNHAITLHANFLIASELVTDGIVLSTAAGAIDKIGLYCVDGSVWEVEAFGTDYAVAA